MPVFVVATKGASYEKVVSNIQEVKARKGKTIAIVTEGDTVVKELADHVIEYSGDPRSIGSLAQHDPVPVDQLSHRCDAGPQRGPAPEPGQSVTVE